MCHVVFTSLLLDNVFQNLPSPMGFSPYFEASSIAPLSIIRGIILKVAFCCLIDSMSVIIQDGYIRIHHSRLIKGTVLHKAEIKIVIKNENAGATRV